MKKLIAIAVIMTSTIGLCGSHNHHRHHNLRQMHHYQHSHHVNHCHHVATHIVSSVVGGIVGGMIVQRARVWVPQQTIIIGYDSFNRPIYQIIPAHWE